MRYPCLTAQVKSNFIQLFICMLVVLEMTHDDIRNMPVRTLGSLCSFTTFCCGSCQSCGCSAPIDFISVCGGSQAPLL